MAYDLLKRAENVVTPLEILNNLAVLEYHAGDLAEALSNCEAALSECQRVVDQGENYFKNIITTIKFNKARILESAGRLEEAEKIYQDVVTERPSYCESIVDSNIGYLRLGISSHKKKCFSEAEDFFKDAIGKNENLVDAWCLLANTQLTLQAVTPSRKTLERVLTKIDKHDVYSLLSLGNIYYLVARHEMDNPKNVQTLSNSSVFAKS